MPFSFAPDLSDDVSKVRLDIGDIEAEGFYLEDETITALIALGGSIGQGSIDSCKYIITQLSQPDFKKDWLTVSNADAKDGYIRILAELRQKYGISTAATVEAYPARQPWRADSDQTDGVYDGSTT